MSPGSRKKLTTNGERFVAILSIAVAEAFVITLISSEKQTFRQEQTKNSNTNECFVYSPQNT